MNQIFKLIIILSLFSNHLGAIRVVHLTFDSPQLVQCLEKTGINVKDLLKIVRTSIKKDGSKYKFLLAANGDVRLLVRTPPNGFVVAYQVNFATRRVTAIDRRSRTEAYDDVVFESDFVTAETIFESPLDILFPVEIDDEETTTANDDGEMAVMAEVIEMEMDEGQQQPQAPQPSLQPLLAGPQYLGRPFPFVPPPPQMQFALPLPPPQMQFAFPMPPPMYFGFANPGGSFWQ